MPLHSLIGETFGWRWAFGFVALLSAPAAWWVWRAMPAGIQPPPLSLGSWGRVLTHPALMAIVAVTACSAAGQFTLFSLLRPVLPPGARRHAPGRSSALFLMVRRLRRWRATCC